MRSVVRALFVLSVLGCSPRAQDDPSTPRETPSEDIRPLEVEGLHNVFRVSARVYSGSVPEGDEGFASLHSLGIKTVISVDGMQPDVEAAGRYGLGYVHLPFGYDGVPHARVAELVKAITTLPGPFYVHCHHGQHRGPAAVAAIQLCTDPSWDTARADAWFKLAGTDPRYTGLVHLPETLVKPTAEELDRLPDSFPSMSSIPDLPRLMVEVDARWDSLKRARAAGWQSPPSHTDVNPPLEAVQLAELFREARRLVGSQNRGAEFDRLMAQAEAATQELEKTLRVKPLDGQRADQAFSNTAAACKDCHRQFRDPPKP